MQLEDATRTQERLRRGEVLGAISIKPQPIPNYLVNRLRSLDYLFVASPSFPARYFPNGVNLGAFAQGAKVALDHLNHIQETFLQQNFDLSPRSVACYIVNSSEAFVQLARQGTTCCMISHLQIERELQQRELIDLTPGLYQRRVLYWHRFAPESLIMRKVTDALLDKQSSGATQG